jgi:hypothetical protein
LSIPGSTACDSIIAAEIEGQDPVEILQRHLMGGDVGLAGDAGAIDQRIDGAEIAHHGAKLSLIERPFRASRL